MLVTLRGVLVLATRSKLALESCGNMFNASNKVFRIYVIRNVCRL